MASKMTGANDPYERRLGISLSRPGLLGELLDTGDAVAQEADEHRLRRRLPVDPVFNIVAVGVALAYFVVGLPDSRNKLLAVHAQHGPAVLNGLFHFRRQRVEPLH